MIIIQTNNIYIFICFNFNLFGVQTAIPDAFIVTFDQFKAFYKNTIIYLQSSNAIDSLIWMKVCNTFFYSIAQYSY